MDRFTSINVFISALEEGSLVAAGRRYGLSASMAGKHVSALEAQLGTRLLQRSTRSLRATEAGQAYYLRCKHIVEAFEEANLAASDASQTVRGTLRIAVPVTYGAMYMGEVIAGFLTQYPQVQAQVIADDGYVDLQGAGIDVAIRIGQLADSTLIARRLGACRMVLCAAPQWMEGAGWPQTPQALRGAARLEFSAAVSPGGWTLRDGNGQVHRIDGPSRMQANNMQVLLSAAKAGLGVVYGPSFVFDAALRAGELVRLCEAFEAPELAIQAVYPSARYLPGKLRCFIDHVAQRLGQG